MNTELPKFEEIRINDLILNTCIFIVTKQKKKKNNSKKTEKTKKTGGCQSLALPKANHNLKAKRTKLPLILQAGKYEIKPELPSLDRISLFPEITVS